MLVIIFFVFLKEMTVFFICGGFEGARSRPMSHHLRCCCCSSSFLISENDSAFFLKVCINNFFGFLKDDGVLLFHLWLWYEILR